MEPLRRPMSGRTTVVISHNLMTLREATSIVVLESGRVAERGTHPELVERDGGYGRLYRLYHSDAEASASAGANISAPQDFEP